MFVYITLAVAYIALFWTTGLRFMREIFTRTSFYRNAEENWSFKGIVAFCLIMTVFLTSIALGPATYLIVERRSRRERARIRAESQERQRLIDEQVARRAVENKRRSPLREKWLSENALRLFYNVMDGITVVMTPASYEIAEKWTQRQKLDGDWENDFLLSPTNSQAIELLFVTKEGLDKVTAATREFHRYKVAGKRSVLQDLVEKHRITLERKENIFVPFTSERFFTFRDQTAFLPDATSINLETALVTSQIPVELREI
jgi:hypothetical protein